MILSDRDLRCYLRRGDLLVEPLTDVQIQPCSIDLRLSPEFEWDGHPSMAWYLDSRRAKEEQPVRVAVADGVPFILQPNDFIRARTVETVQIPHSIVGKIEGRSTFARLGIEIHQTGGWIDPGFRGTIVLEIKNNNNVPVGIWPGDRVCQLVLYQLSSAALRPYGHKDIGSKYQDQTAVVGARADAEARRG